MNILIALELAGIAGLLVLILANLRKLSADVAHLKRSAAVSSGAHPLVARPNAAARAEAPQSEAPPPAPAPVAWPPAPPMVEILKRHAGSWARIGFRSENHPDVQHALDTPGLAIRRQDQDVEVGVQPPLFD